MHVNKSDEIWKKPFPRVTVLSRNLYSENKTYKLKRFSGETSHCMIFVTVSTHRFNNVNPFSLALLNYDHTPSVKQRKILSNISIFSWTNITWWREERRLSERIWICNQHFLWHFLLVYRMFKVNDIRIISKTRSLKVSTLYKVKNLRHLRTTLFCILNFSF